MANREEKEMSNKDSILLDHNNLLPAASGTRSAYFEFLNADDESTMGKSVVYESKLNDLNEMVLSLLESSPSKG